jgi:type I restriction enzyme S subunit
MTDGLKPEHRQAIIETLSANPKVERIVLFGSRATGTFTLTSDVDIALFGEDLTLSDQAALAEAVAELNIPQRVDILIFHRIANQALRDDIRKHGVEWFARGRAAWAVDSEWQELPFSQAVTVNPHVHLRRGETYPFVDMSAISPGWRSAYASERRMFNGGGARFATGDTLMARITPCLENGKIARFAGRPGEVAHGSTEFIVIRGRDGVSDTDYAYYLTKWDGVSGYAISQMTGTSGRQRVPLEAFDHLIVPLPPLPEQRAIAHILGTLDDKIELNRRMSQTLEGMARALFKAWFVDFEPVRAKLDGRWQRGQSLPGLPAELYDLFPNRLVDSELGEIPEGWEIRSLDEIARFLNGLALQKYPPKGNHLLPVVKIAQLRAGHTNGADRASADIAPEYVVDDGDILFSWSGSLECVVWAGGKGALNQHLFKVMPSGYPRWLCYFGIHEHLEDFRHIAAGKATTMGHIQRHHLSSAKLAIPAIDSLGVIDRHISPFFETSWKKKLESRALAALRDALLPKLIRGQIRVKDAERFLERHGQ